MFPARAPQWLQTPVTVSSRWALAAPSSDAALQRCECAGDLATGAGLILPACFWKITNEFPKTFWKISKRFPKFFWNILRTIPTFSKHAKCGLRPRSLITFQQLYFQQFYPLI